MLADLGHTTEWFEIIAAIVVILTFVGAVTGGVWRWVIKPYVREQFADLTKKATPNGGDTLELGDTAGRTEEKVDELRGMFTEHLLHHPGPSMPGAVKAPESSTPTRREVEAAQAE